MLGKDLPQTSRTDLPCKNILEEPGRSGKIPAKNKIEIEHFTSYNESAWK